MVAAFPTFKTNPEQAVRLTRRIWVARFDVVEENRYVSSSENVNLSLLRSFETVFCVSGTWLQNYGLVLP